MNLSKLILVTTVITGLLGFGQFASAQATRTWVSGVGDDANPCSRTAPCKTFAGAISKTAADGIINCLDTGAFGAVTITKSIAISCEGVTAGVLHSATNGIVVNAAATDIVVLRGLFIDGSPASSPGLNGVRFIAGGALLIENCTIRESTGASPNGNGVLFAPTAGSPRLQISDSFISGHGTGTGGAGIQIEPTTTGGAEVVINNTVVSNSTVGIRANAASTTGTIQVNISNSVASNNRYHGIVALGGNGPLRMMLDRVVSSNNSAEGVRASGSNIGLRIGRSTVTYNGTGVTASAGANVASYGDNFIDANVVAGITPTVVSQK